MDTILLQLSALLTSPPLSSCAAGNTLRNALLLDSLNSNLSYYLGECLCTLITISRDLLFRSVAVLVCATLSVLHALFGISTESRVTAAYIFGDSWTILAWDIARSYIALWLLRRTVAIIHHLLSPKSPVVRILVGPLSRFKKYFTRGSPNPFGEGFLRAQYGSAKKQVGVAQLGLGSVTQTLVDVQNRKVGGVGGEAELEEEEEEEEQQQQMAGGKGEAELIAGVPRPLLDAIVQLTQGTVTLSNSVQSLLEAHTKKWDWDKEEKRVTSSRYLLNHPRLGSYRRDWLGWLELSLTLAVVTPLSIRCLVLLVGFPVCY